MEITDNTNDSKMKIKVQLRDAIKVHIVPEEQIFEQETKQPKIIKNEQQTKDEKQNNTQN